MKRVTLLSLLLCTLGASAQSLTEWTEGAGPLGLGYPVPVPVDTPLPFDGFRTWSGLHRRHQDFAAVFDTVTGHVVGQTESGRDIWLYQMSDDDSLTATGLAEGAVLTQGTIHAREWQSPETLTGIMERLVAQREDGFINQFLLENVNLLLIPVLNIDGLLQTQRFPTLSYLEGTSPRDGRMRRKNMRGVDEDIDTADDRLLGIDLNRNNPPFWASSTRSSATPSSIVFHGSGPHSEAETQAMAAAVELGPADRLRLYTDVHSFSQVHYSVRTFNQRRNAIQTGLLSDFSGFHAQLSGGKFYVDVPSGPGGGIGSTDEYFAETFQVPSWTLEIEPSGTLQPDAHPSLPGCGADYGGLASNCHDGFVLPESEIGRVRRNLGQTFPVVYYHQAGPPSIMAVRWVHEGSSAVVFDAEWDVTDAGERTLHVNQLQPLALDTSYRLYVSFDKPMRWRNPGGAVIPLPGQALSAINVTSSVQVGNASISPVVGAGQWVDQPGSGQDRGYYRYRDDTWSASLIPDTATLGSEVTGVTPATLEFDTRDMVGLRLDANPATAADWGDGSWQNYEDGDGAPGDAGGADRTVVFNLTDASAQAPFVIVPGMSAAWFDPSHDGEGFVIEILDDDRTVLYWFTYDNQGNQRWFIAEGFVRGNELYFPDLLESSGGIFGPNFDPDQVVFRDAGQASFLWSGCNTASMRHDVLRFNQRQSLTRLSNLAGLDCTPGQSPAGKGQSGAGLSGSWFDPSHNGEGFVVEMLGDGRAIVFWFTYDDTGRQAWIFGDGTVSGETITIDNALISSGGIFGDAFDPEQVQFQSWGRFTLDLDCEAATGTASYDSLLPQFGAGSQSLIRLTRLSGIDCQP